MGDRLSGSRKPLARSELEELSSDLDRADELFMAGLQEPHERGREGVTLVLRRLSNFLQDQGIGPRVSLTHLIVALENVSRGHAQPLMTPSLPYRPRDTRRNTFLKAFSAAAMETLMATGVGKLDAARAVAKVLAKAGYRLPGKKLPRGETVASWRDKFMGHAGDSEGARYFRRARAVGKDDAVADRAKALLGSVELLAKSR